MASENNSAYRGIVFDKDGTLIDFNATWLPIYRHAALACSDNDALIADALLAQHGYDFDNARFIGGSLLAAGNNREIALAWGEQLPTVRNNADVENLYLQLSQIFQQQGAIYSAAVQGLQATVEQLKQTGMHLGIATSDSYQGIHNTLQSFAVLQHFDFLCGYDSGHGVKPEAGMVLAFCEALSLDPAQVVVVGDNRHDMEMGRNAQVGLCVGVLTGTSTRSELELIADIVIDDIRALPSLLNS